MPLPDKVQAIKHIAVSTNKKQLRSYRDMCKQRSDILDPLTKLTSIQATSNWTKDPQKALEHVKKFISINIS